MFLRIHEFFLFCTKCCNSVVAVQTFIFLFVIMKRVASLPWHSFWKITNRIMSISPYLCSRVFINMQRSLEKKDPLPKSRVNTWVNTQTIFTYPLGIYPPHVTIHNRGHTPVPTVPNEKICYKLLQKCFSFYYSKT